MQLLSKVLLLGNVGFLLDYSPTRVIPKEDLQSNQKLRCFASLSFLLAWT